MTAGKVHLVRTPKEAKAAIAIVLSRMSRPEIGRAEFFIKPPFTVRKESPLGERLQRGDKMRHAFSMLIATAALTVAAPAFAQSTTVDFSTAPFSDPFTGAYSQNGYTLTYVSGRGILGPFGIGTENLVGETGSTSSFTLDRSGGGLFSIQGFSGATGYIAGNDTVTFALAGYLAGVNTYNQTFSFTGNGYSGGSSFVTAPLANTFDELSFTVNQTATSGYVNRLSLTSLVPAISAVPEPATWATMIFGLGMIGFAMRRKVRASEVAFDAKIKRISEGVNA